MPIITEPIEEVKEYIENNVDIELTPTDISEIWLLILVGVLMYFFSGFISSLIKIAGVLLVILCLYTLYTATY